MNRYKDHSDMMDLLRKIAPLTRTLASADTDRALGIVQESLPGSVIEGTPSGSKAWSWVIPPRWELQRATIKANGITLVDSAWSILHVINYSQPFKGIVAHDELLKHIKRILIGLMQFLFLLIFMSQYGDFRFRTTGWTGLLVISMR